MDVEMNLIFLFFLMCWFFIQVRLMEGCSVVWVLYLYEGDERWHRREEALTLNSNFALVGVASSRSLQKLLFSAKCGL